MNRPDPRFFEALGPTTLGALAELTGARLDPALSETQIQSSSVLADAGRDAVSFLADRKFAEAAASTQAAAWS